MTEMEKELKKVGEVVFYAALVLEMLYVILDKINRGKGAKSLFLNRKYHIFSFLQEYFSKKHTSFLP